MLGRKQRSGTSKQRNSFQSNPTSFVLKVPLHYSRPSVIYSVPYDQILQRACSKVKCKFIFIRRCPRDRHCHCLSSLINSQNQPLNWAAIGKDHLISGDYKSPGWTVTGESLTITEIQAIPRVSFSANTTEASFIIKAFGVFDTRMFLLALVDVYSETIKLDVALTKCQLATIQNKY